MAYGSEFKMTKGIRGFQKGHPTFAGTEKTQFQKGHKFGKRFKKGDKPHDSGKTKDNYAPLMKSSISHKKLWEDKDYKDWRLRLSMNGRKMRPTIPERVFMNLMKENNLFFDYVGGGSLIIGGFNPDFISIDKKHIIEIFGEYWHTLPKRVKQDEERLRTYHQRGYKVLVIWEHELTGRFQNKIIEEVNLNSIVARVRNFLSEI